MKRALFVCGAALATACATPETERDLFVEPLRGRDPIAQGWIGVSELQSDDYENGTQFPVVGGAFQQPLAGDARGNLGFEAGIGIEFESDVRLVSSGGSGLTVIADTDMLLVDGFVGPYGELLLGERWRLYAATGGLLQYARSDGEVNDSSTGVIRVEEDAFDGGLYARCGIEFLISPYASLGFGVRWIDTEVDLGPTLGAYDLERVQWLFTLTRND